MTPVEHRQAFIDELHLRGMKAPVESTEIYYWLNAAQDAYVRERFTVLDSKADLTDDIRTLRKTGTSTAKYTGDQYLSFTADAAPFPEDYLFLIALRALVRFNPRGLDYTSDPPVGEVRTPREFNSANVPCRISQQDDIYKLLMDPFNWTKTKSPLAVLHENTVKVYTDTTFTVSAVSLDYISLPARISSATGCALPAFTHREVARRAAILFTELPSTQRGERRPPPTQSPS